MALLLPDASRGTTAVATTAGPLAPTARLVASAMAARLGFDGPLGPVVDLGRRGATLPPADLLVLATIPGGADLPATADLAGVTVVPVLVAGGAPDLQRRLRSLGADVEEPVVLDGIRPTEVRRALAARATAAG